MSQRPSIGIGLMGLGVVGSGVARILQEKAEVYARQIGIPLELRRVLVRDVNKARDCDIDPAILTTDATQILGDPDVQLVIEVMGGDEPAYAFLRAALEGFAVIIPEEV